MTRIRLWRWLLAPALCLTSAPALAVAPSVNLSPAVGHPAIAAEVSGKGFGANEAVDIYFDTTDAMLVVTNVSGAFAAHKLNIPASALPGAHWITAVGRRDGNAAQKLFTVRTDWVEHGFATRGRFYNPYENVLDTANVASLDTMWKANFAVNDGVGASPSVAGGRLYVGTANGIFYSLDTATGAKLWHKSQGRILVAPAVSGNAVYYADLDENVYALDAVSGAPLWVVRAANVGSSSPVVAGGLVYLGSANAAASGQLLALDASTGAVVWSRQTGPILQSPTVADGVVYVGADDGTFDAFGAAGGAPLWSVTEANGIGSAPVVANGVVYFETADGTFHALNAQTGTQLWVLPTGVPGASPMSVADGVAYFGTGNGILWALDPRTQAVLWSQALDGVSDGAPTVANDVLYVSAALNGHGEIYAVDAKTGSILWTGTVGGFIADSPVVADGVVYVGSDDGSVYTFALDGGDNVAYRRSAAPPPFASLRPDMRLKPEHD